MRGDEAEPGSAREEALQDTGRILSLTDGIFAFAMTLLVLSLVVPSAACSLPTAHCENGNLNNPDYSPTLWNYLQNDWAQVYAYILAFIIIAVWWSLHHSVFGFIKRYDTRLLWLNMMFLLGIAVTPFVLGVRSTFDQTAAANELYGGSQALVGALMCAIVYYATDHHRLVNPKMTAAEIGAIRLRAVFLTVAFGATVPVAFISVPASQSAWIVILAGFALIRRIREVLPKLPRKRDRLPLVGDHPLPP
jgi:TMEM175 potassium channel family protein